MLDFEQRPGAAAGRWVVIVDPAIGKAPALSPWRVGVGSFDQRLPLVLRLDLVYAPGNGACRRLALVVHSTALGRPLLGPVAARVWCHRDLVRDLDLGQRAHL